MEEKKTSGRTGILNYLLDFSSLDLETFKNFVKISYFIILLDAAYSLISYPFDEEFSPLLFFLEGFGFFLMWIFSIKKLRSMENNLDHYLFSHLVWVRFVAKWQFLMVAFGTFVLIAAQEGFNIVNSHPDLWKLIEFAMDATAPMVFLVISFYGIKSLRDDKEFTL